MNIAYVRVSTIEQNESRQLEALKQYGIDKWFTEKISAKDMNRPELKKMLEFAREGDTIYVQDFSRIARDTGNLLDLVKLLNRKGIHLVSDKDKIDTSSVTGKLFLTIIAAINEFERNIMLERQREGIANAKKAGKYKGRKAIYVPNFEEHYNRYIHREINKAALSKELNISRPTLDKLIRARHKSDRYIVVENELPDEMIDL